MVPDPTSGLTYPSLVIVEGGPKAIKKYNEAINLYHEQKFKEAIELFEELETVSKTKIYTIFKLRAIEFLDEKNIFSSVYIHKDK